MTGNEVPEEEETPSREGENAGRVEKGKAVTQEKSLPIALEK